MPLIAALDGMTPEQIADKLTILADYPWLTIVRINTPNGDVWNIHLDPDSAESPDFCMILEKLPMGSVLRQRSTKVRTLGSARELTLQFVSP